MEGSRQISGVVEAGVEHDQAKRCASQRKSVQVTAHGQEAPGEEGTVGGRCPQTEIAIQAGIQRQGPVAELGKPVG
jgi:hypothetical protein